MERTFIEYENKGRAKYEKLCGIPHEFMEDQFAKWDVSATGKSHTFNVEIKDRDIPYTKYASQGFMLEKIKYDALMEAWRDSGSVPVFINFFQDNTGFWWDLRCLDPEWKEMLCTSTTADGTYGNSKVAKTVTLVYPEQGKKFRY